MRQQTASHSTRLLPRKLGPASMCVGEIDLRAPVYSGSMCRSPSPKPPNPSFLCAGAASTGAVTRSWMFHPFQLAQRDRPSWSEGPPRKNEGGLILASLAPTEYTRL